MRYPVPVGRTADSSALLGNIHHVLGLSLPLISLIVQMHVLFPLSLGSTPKTLALDLRVRVYTCMRRSRQLQRHTDRSILRPGLPLHFGNPNSSILLKLQCDSRSHQMFVREGVASWVIPRGGQNHANSITDARKSSSDSRRHP